MAVFVSASDESDGGHHRSKFWHGGFVAPETDWFTYFAPAWDERVLKCHPEIPYLHMSEIRDRAWQKKHKIALTELQIDYKLTEAAFVIDAMGSLYPIAVNMSGATFLDAFGKNKVIQNVAGDKPMRFLIDHFSFNTYVLSVLLYVRDRHPEAEKVDFLVERKDGVWEKLKQFYDTFGDALKMVGYGDLVPLMGELNAVGKDRVPVQAADMLCWHASRADLGLLKGRDAGRGELILNRRGSVSPIEDEVIRELAMAFIEKMNEQEKRISEFRQDDGPTIEGSSQRDQGEAGSGEKGEEAEA